MDEKNAVFLAAGGECVVFLQRALSEIQSLTAKDAEDAKENQQLNHVRISLNVVQLFLPIKTRICSANPGKSVRMVFQTSSMSTLK